MLKGFKHSSSKEEHFSVLLKSLETKDESLLAGKSNAKNETSAIVAEVERIGLNKDKIKGLVFDTSVNTGIHKGICVELEKYVGRRLLLLGCCHHIFELACGASCAEVYGETKSPEESVFKILKTN